MSKPYFAIRNCVVLAKGSGPGVGVYLDEGTVNLDGTLFYALGAYTPPPLTRPRLRKARDAYHMLSALTAAARWLS